VPELRLLLLLLDIELFEQLHFVLKLNQKPDFSRQAEVADHQVRDCLQEGNAIDLLLVTMEGQEVLSLDHTDLHDVPDIQTLDPLRLIQKTQHVLHIRLGLP